MTLDLIDPIVTAAVSVLTSIFGEVPEKGQIGLRPSSTTTQPVNIVCGVTGQVTGTLLFGMQPEMAERIASKMIGAPTTLNDPMAFSALAELGNIISGHGVCNICERGRISEITPPTIIRGADVEIVTVSITCVTIPFFLLDGEFHVTIGLMALK